MRNKDFQLVKVGIVLVVIQTENVFTKITKLIRIWYLI